MSDYRDQNHEQNQGRENGSGQSGWTYYNGSQRPREERGANQYSSSNGWQEQQPQDQRPGQESYRWNYDDYDIPKNGGKRKNSGLVSLSASLPSCWCWAWSLWRGWASTS